MALDKDGNETRKRGATSGNGGVRSKYRSSGGDGPIRWDIVEPGLLLACIDAVTESGDAIVFARSSDGGVLSITVCTGADRVKFYSKDYEEANGVLARITKQAGGKPDAL